MLTELQGKGGRLCQPAQDGELHCPLIVRPTSEDAITGNLFGVLECINPRRWLPQLLNEALGTNRYRQQIYRNLRIELWQKQPKMPRHLICWDEGQTEVDVVISWENPATTVFIEMKYGSPLSATTSHNSGQEGHPADQLIRNARIGLYQSGWYQEERLFEMPPRQFLLILLTPRTGNPLVAEYRDPDRLRAAIPHAGLLPQLPDLPFIGELSFRGLCELLESQTKFMSTTEKRLVQQLNDYLRFKLDQLPKSNGKK